VVDKRGSYYYYHDELVAQGREPELFAVIEAAVRQALFGVNGGEFARHQSLRSAVTCYIPAVGFGKSVREGG
jgi:hypothetical protein